MPFDKDKRPLILRKYLTIFVRYSIFRTAYIKKAQALQLRHSSILAIESLKIARLPSSINSFNSTFRALQPKGMLCD